MGMNQDDHHMSGDSIPVGCEASHLEVQGRLDVSQDSGMVSLTKEGSYHQPLPQVQGVKWDFVPLNLKKNLTYI